MSQTPESPRPLLMLCMIVRNERDDILRTLASVKPFIDAWSILDTGSTDGTQDQIREALSGVPGTLHEAPFVDFATSRNQAMELAGTACEYLLFLDAEDELHDGDRLRAYLAADASGAGAFSLTLRRAGLTYRLPLVTRTSARWRYRGVVHEFVAGPQGERPRVFVPDVVVSQVRSPASAERTRARWERDLALLQAQTARDPQDARAVFYLAQTHQCLGQLPEAVAAYRRRVELGGWQEEAFAALYRLAGLLEGLGHPWPEVQQLYLEAFALHPHRAEPLFQIARHYAAEEAHTLVFLFARRAYQLPPPSQDVLFVEHEVYEWMAADLVATSALRVGQRELGERAARQALAARPDNPVMQARLADYEGHRHTAGTPASPTH